MYFSLFKLPPKLRNEVYKYALVQERDIWFDIMKTVPGIIITQNSQISQIFAFFFFLIFREFYHEPAAIIYNNNMFRFCGYHAGHSAVKS